MKNLILCAICALCFILPFYLYSAKPQKVVVDKLIHKPLDLSASSAEVPKDLNGNPCGLLKVITEDDSFEFEGAIIGSPIYKNGEFWIYLPQGTFQLKIKSDQKQPVLLNFKDYNLKSVESKNTYELTLMEEEYDRLNKYRVIQGPNLERYAVSILTIPDLEYAKRIAKELSEYGDAFGEKYNCTIIANTPAMTLNDLSDEDRDALTTYRVIAESSDDEDDAIICAGASLSFWFDPTIFIVE